MTQRRRVVTNYALWLLLIAVAAAVLYWVARQRDDAPPVPPASRFGAPGEDELASLRDQIADLAERLEALERRGVEQSERLAALARRLESLRAERAPSDGAAARRAPSVVVYLHRELAAVRGSLHERLTQAGFRVRIVPEPDAARPFDLDGFPAVDGYGALSPLGGEGSVVRFSEAAAPQARRLARLAGELGIGDVTLRRDASGERETIELVLAPRRLSGK